MPPEVENDKCKHGILIYKAVFAIAHKITKEMEVA